MNEQPRNRRMLLRWTALMLVVALVTIGLVALLTNIFERKQEARKSVLPRRRAHRRHRRPCGLGQAFPAAV